MIHFFKLFAAVQVMLAWDVSPGSGVAGYRLHYGTMSSVYTQQVDVGNVSYFTVSNLSQGVEYFFVVTAYNQAGVESQPSNEVAYTSPVSPSPTPGPTIAPVATATPFASPSASPPRTPSPTPGITFWSDAALTIPFPNDTLNFSSQPFVQPSPGFVWVRTSNGSTWGSSDGLTWLDAGNVSGVASGKFLAVQPNAGLGNPSYTGDITISAGGLLSKMLHAKLTVGAASPSPTRTPSPSPSRTPSPAPTISPAPTATVSPSPTRTPSPSPTVSPSASPSPSPSCTPCLCGNR